MYKSSTKALLNKDFRQALLFAFDRTAYSTGSQWQKKQQTSNFVIRFVP